MRSAANSEVTSVMNPERNFKIKPGMPGSEEFKKEYNLKYPNIINIIKASVFINMTEALVYYRLKGIKREGDKIIIPNRIIGKFSRPEVAS